MKSLKFLSIFLILVLLSCGSVSVNSDYDKKIQFENYKTFAYLKSTIDKAEISDLDKKRILHSIDESMISKGFSKNDNPDILISIFTKENQRVDVYNNSGFTFGWSPFWGTGIGYNYVNTTPEGTLFIDILDAKTKELVWQGEGSGYLTKNTDKKDARIKEFVDKILAQYPPQKK